MLHGTSIRSGTATVSRHGPTAAVRNSIVHLKPDDGTGPAQKVLASLRVMGLCDAEQPGIAMSWFGQVANRRRHWRTKQRVCGSAPARSSAAGYGALVPPSRPVAVRG